MKEQTTLCCKPCGFYTNRPSLMDRHYKTNTHKRYLFFCKNDSKSVSDGAGCSDRSDSDGSSVDLTTKLGTDELQETDSNINDPYFPVHLTDNMDGSHMDNSENQNFEEVDPSGEKIQGHRTRWFPFESKIEMLLYVFMNSLTHPISDEVVKFVMYMLHEVGVQTPAFSKLKDMQFGECRWEDLLQKGEDKDSTPFWIIKPSEIVKLLIAQPCMAESLIRRPVCSDSGINHPAAASKWHNDIEFPTTYVNGKLYFSGRIYTWTLEGEHEMGILEKFQDNILTDTTEGILTILKTPDINWSMSTVDRDRSLLKTSQQKILPLHCLKEASEATYQKQLWNRSGNGYAEESTVGQRLILEKERQLQNVPIISVPLNLFLDDTSANRSKRWMALHCVQMQLSGIPIAERQKNGNIFYLSASEKVEIMEICQLIVNDIQQSNRLGIECFDAMTQKTCIVKPAVDVVVADGSMLSYCCNHLGSSAIKYCPRCYADAEHFMCDSVKRTPDGTKRTIGRINLRSTEARKKQIRKKRGVKEHPNCFWDVLDPHKDIPIGILHLISLGLIKHLVQHVSKSVSESTKDALNYHFVSTCSKNSSDEFYHYLHSRQGKDFKEYMQIAPFNFAFAEVPEFYIEMAVCLSEIQKKVYMDVFSTELLSSLREDIRRYQQLVATYTPEMQRKAKTHILLHLVEDIQRHGPPKAYMEDGFEKNHRVIRDQLFNQNQKARSRDSAISFAKNFLVQHIFAGGFIKVENEWKQASQDVRNKQQDKQLQKYMGFPPEEKSRRPGDVSKLKRNFNNHTLSEDVSNDLLLGMADMEVNIDLNSTAVKASAVTAKDGNLVNELEWIRYLNSDGQVCFGIFVIGYLIDNKYMMVEIKIAESIDGEQILNCPIYHLKDDRIIILSTEILEKASFLHDCKGGHCKIVQRLRTERIEQEVISRRKKYLKHNYNHKCYILNIYSLKQSK